MPSLRTTSQGGSDRNITRIDENYNTVRAGNGSTSAGGVSDNYNYDAVGQTKGGPGLTSVQYQFCESGLRFPIPAPPSHSQIVSAWFCIHGGNFAGNQLRNIELRLHGGFGTGDVFNNEDFVAGANLGSLDSYGLVADVNQSTETFYPMCCSNDILMTRVRDFPDTAIHVLVTTNRQRAGNTPTSDERNGLYFGNNPETYLRPAIVRQVMTTSALDRIQGASAQLSDGTSIYLREDGTLCYSLDNAVEQEIAQIAFGTGSRDFDSDAVGRQIISLCVDRDDNIWVVGKGGSGGSIVVGQAFIKGAGYTWAIRQAQQWTAPSYAGGDINNVAVTWHNTTGTWGHLVVMLGRRAGTGFYGQIGWTVISCNNLQAGVGGYIADSGVNPGMLYIDKSTWTPNVRYVNDTGTGIDVMSRDFANTGMFMTFAGTIYIPGHGAYWPSNEVRIARYNLNAQGNLSRNSAEFPEDGIQFDLHPDTHAKLIAIDGDRFALAYGDRIHVYDWSGSRLGADSLADPTFYDRPVDWFYDPAANRIWAYYESSPGSRQIVKRGMSLQTFGLGGQTNVGALIGVAGDTITNIRLPRGPVNERNARIEVAYRTVVGDSHVLTVLDDASLNTPPQAPNIGTRPSFDAAQPATFTWTFSDINTDDAQTAYELEIYRTIDDVLIYDTGKILSGNQSHTVPGSTLSNDSGYYWRVRVWDLADAFSNWSPQGVFTTISTAVTTITSPPIDNPADAVSSSYLVTWSTTQITQARYRMLVVLTQNGQVILDTGFITSTQTARQLTGLENGQEYQITVWVRNNVDIESSPGQRLLTPNYVEPVTPVLILSHGDSYIEITVDNPDPTAEEPEPQRNDLYRAESGTDEYIRIASIPNDGIYRDYAVKSGQSYDYYVIAVV